MKKLVLILAAFIFMAPALSAGNTISSLEDVQQGLRSGQLRSANDFFFGLDPAIRNSDPALPFASTAGRPSSAMRPSVVQASRDGTFWVAYPTDETQTSAYNRFEFATAGPPSWEPDFFVVDFNSASPVIIKNRGDCMVCHRIHGRRHLRIEAYPFWDGWYGTSGVFQVSKEVRQHEFAASTSLLDAPLQPERLEHFQISRKRFEYPATLSTWAHHGASQLNFLSQRILAKQIAYELRKHPDHQAVRLAILEAIYTSRQSRTLAQSTWSKSMVEKFERVQNDLEIRLRSLRSVQTEFLNAQYVKMTGASLGKTENQVKVSRRTLVIEFFLNEIGLSLANFTTAGEGWNENDGLSGGLDAPLMIVLIEEMKAEGWIQQELSYENYWHFRDIEIPDNLSESPTLDISALQCRVTLSSN
ncbi:MAG: hypothetical protein AAF202_07880 [Pseudomonadota bacterium]